MTAARRAPVLLAFAAVRLCAASPDTWVPARWDGGPLEVAHRATAKAPADPAVRDALARWYDPSTLSLLDGMPVNCLLLTLSGGTDAESGKRQQQLVTAYARKARERGLAVLGLVYPGPSPETVAAAVTGAALDGAVLEGDFPGGFVGQLEKALRMTGSAAVVIPIASAAQALRRVAWPVLAVEGVAPGTGKIAQGAAASASGALWIDSNMWLVRWLRLGAQARPVWLSHRVGGSSGDYLKSIADAETAGGRWILALGDDLRASLLRRDPKAMSLWRSMGDLLSFLRQPQEWRDFAPFGNVGIVVGNANSEELLNLVARRRIPYRVIDRGRLDAASLAGLRAVLAFDLAPPAAAERKLLQDFAAQGGLVLGGPSWGNPPKEQPYTVQSVEQGEVAVYRDASPDPQAVAGDLNDLLTTPDFGVSLFNAPSVLPYVSASKAGDRMAIQLLNYADTPAESLAIWTTRKFSAARLYLPGSAPADLPVKRSGRRTEIAIPPFPVYGALVLE